MFDGEPLLLTATLLWLFVLGSTVGSFLNVVVYRMPAGLSLLFPSSHCPSCKTPIRLRDNVPIFGWLLLRGKCRDCGIHISPRYPLVELATALVFVILAWFEPLSNATNLPWVGFLRAQPAVGQHMLTMTNLWGIYAFHLFLFCSLLVAALIEYDGRSLPGKLIVTPMLVGLIAPIAWPWLKPFPTHLTNISTQWMAGIESLVLGAVLGLFIWRISRTNSIAKMNTVCPSAVLAWAGVFLGERGFLYPAAIAAVVSFSTAILARYWPALDRIPWSGWFSMVLFTWLIQWRTIVYRLPDPIAAWDLYFAWDFYLFILAIFAILALSGLTARIRIRNFDRRCGL